MSFANYKATGIDDAAFDAASDQQRPALSSLPLPLDQTLSSQREPRAEEAVSALKAETVVRTGAVSSQADGAGDRQSAAVALTAEERNLQAIKSLMMRLADLLFLTSGSIPPQEKSLADDIISKLFSKAPRDTRFKLVERMLQHTEPPSGLVRTMLHSEDEIALPILRSPIRLKQADLISVVTTSGPIYQRAVAEREDLHSAVCDAIIQCADISTIRVLLRNASSVISRNGFVRLAEKSLKEPGVLEPLIERTDFPPDLAHLVFWWAPSVLRRKIIERFASPRQTVFEVIPRDLAEDFDDMLPEVANAFRMVRQARKMERQSIDLALQELESGDANIALDVLAEGAHLKPETIAQIFDDPGGEALGVFSKATGFGRERFMKLRSILAARKDEPWNDAEALNDDVSLVHDTLSTDKADLILRYWDRATREVEV